MTDLGDEELGGSPSRRRDGRPTVDRRRTPNTGIALVAQSVAVGGFEIQLPDCQRHESEILFSK